MESKEVSIAKPILDRWATQVVPNEAIWVKGEEAQVNQNKIAHYEERKYQGDEVLWLPPPNCIRIEFEDTPTKNHKFLIQIESVAKALSFDYCITGHKGKSDYFNMFNIEGIPTGEDNKAAKLLLIDLLIPKAAKDQLDRTNLGWTLSPVIEHSHWKPKYNGNIHKILRGKNPIEHKNEYPKDLLKLLKKAKEQTKKNRIKLKQNTEWVESFLLDYCCNNNLPAGSRHFIIEKNLAAFLIFRKDKDEIKQKYYQSQGRTTDTMRTWEAAILRGDYTEVSAGELGKFIKDHSIPFDIPPPTKVEEKGGLLTIKLDNYIDNVELFWENNPFFYDKSNMFWLWNDDLKKYEMVDDIDMMILIDNVLGFEGQTVGTGIKNNYLEAFKRVGRIHIPKDAPKKWIQFKDKAISLKSGKVYNITPDFFFTNPIPYELGENEDTPTIDKLIIEWVGEKYKETTYEIIAYCCYANYPIHLIFCLVGTGRNGKSKFLGLINNFVGKGNICSTELDVLLDSRFESFKLYKKLVCTMGETNFGIISKTSLLKKLTGQDLIGFEFKNKRPFDDYNYAKIIISSNSLPPSEDTSEGFYRRWLILDFPNTFPEGKDILQIIPKIEYNNLALKVSRILPKLLGEGHFTNQGTIKERTDRYIMASNPLSHFIKEHCKKSLTAFMRYSELYIAYRKYLYNNKKRRIGYKEFNDVLALEGLEIIKTSKKIGEEWINGKFIEGIELVKVVQLVNGISLKSTYRDLSEITGTSFTSSTEPKIEEEPVFDIIHAKCNICGTEPSHIYNIKGQPLCKECYKAENAQKVA